jgi:hypothetical protein
MTPYYIEDNMKKKRGVLFLMLPILSVLFLSPASPDLTGEVELAEAELLPTFSPPVTLWFVSNEMGQALRNAYSLTALREKYALSIMPVYEEFLPDEYRPHYESGWTAECRTLYEDGELMRTQWVFMDEGRVTRFVSAKSPEGAGFTETYNEKGLLTEESRFDAPTEEETEDGELVFTESVPTIITYSYREDFLTGAKSEEWADIYRYARNNQIRVIERTYLATETRTRVNLPRTIKDISFNGTFFVSPTSASTSVFLQDVLLDTGTNTVYTLNEKGRILTETRRGEKAKAEGAEGAEKETDREITGTLTNTWDGDRIVSVTWERGEDKRRVDYVYDGEGELVNEKNYRDETLEREVAIEGDEEIETLYLNGQPALRAVWQDGRKIHEESLRATGRPAASRRRG